MFGASESSAAGADGVMKGTSNPNVIKQSVSRRVISTLLGSVARLILPEA